MDVFTAIKERRSIREFTKKEPDGPTIQKLIQALIAAPSAGNLQSRKFYFVKDEKVKKELAQAALNQSFIMDAPIVIVACTDARIGNNYGGRGVGLYAIQDAACSVMSMMLLAVELGLGSVWVGAFREDEVRTALKIPESLRPVALVPVGFPKKIPAPTPKVSPEEAVRFV